ncbi:hypothetical protein INT44_009365 [Umbelopsis vinacea]|uniref:Uncharacterized protein n=1 Tax=Umbelopsis vinacea TaxID=44442 RepID=A0A8H7Q2Y7_9FUNG|nr:hypothetical protein INT44_009365 [Umbelopsis vinacea]
MAACPTGAPAIICPVIIPGMEIRPRIDMPLMVGSMAVRTDSMAIGFAASHRHAPAVALIQLETIIPTVGMNFVGFQNGVSFNPILVPAMEMAIVLTPTETKTERNFSDPV